MKTSNQVLSNAGATFVLASNGESATVSLGAFGVGGWILNHTAVVVPGIMGNSTSSDGGSGGKTSGAGRRAALWNLGVCVGGLPGGQMYW